MNSAKFGKKAKGDRLKRMLKSPNFFNGQFRNLHHTPQLAEDTNGFQAAIEFFFKKSKRNRPCQLMPSTKTDLLKLDSNENVLIWFGHSSYFVQVEGKTFLADPVFSGNASPIDGSNKAFAGTDRYSVEDMPDIDYLIITHDHYDHADYETLLKLQPKVRSAICGLGVGAHLERWGYDEGAIIEKDWNESIQLGDGFIAHIEPARHFSGRSFKRNTTLWMSLLLQTPARKIFFGGDSGYDTHFADIGARHGPVDLAILENGQYNQNWKYIHMLPHQVLQAAIDLKAKQLFPVHHSKFAMSTHAWDDPLNKLSALNVKHNIALILPKIGQKVNLDSKDQCFDKWWLAVS